MINYWRKSQSDQNDTHKIKGQNSFIPIINFVKNQPNANNKNNDIKCYQKTIWLPAMLAPEPAQVLPVQPQSQQEE